MRQCDGCRHWHPDPGSNPPAKSGECRRRGPRLAPEGAVYAQGDCAPYGYWPLTTFSQWCGEWQPIRALEGRKT